MSTITLSVSRVTPDPGPPRTIIFQSKPPYAQPTYLAVVTLIENSGLSAIDGVIEPGGGPNDGGTCDLDMPEALFNPIWDFVDAHHTKLSVTLTYDDADLTVTRVSIASASAIIDTGLLEAALA